MVVRAKCMGPRHDGESIVGAAGVHERHRGHGGHRGRGDVVHQLLGIEVRLSLPCALTDPLPDLCPISVSCIRPRVDRTMSPSKSRPQRRSRARYEHRAFC